MSKVEQVKISVKNLIRFGKSQSEINRILNSSTDFSKNISESVLNSIIDNTIQEYPDYNLIQKIMRSKLIADKDEEDKSYIILDPLSIERDSIHRTRLNKLLSSKVDLSHKIYTCKFEYRPFDNNVLIKSPEGAWIYNCYIPPIWYQDVFYSKGSLEVLESDLPESIHKFLFHLVAGDKPSYKYILDWLANGIQGRNHCILTTIGSQGIGKGVLGEIMRHIFGRENFFAGRDEMFKSRFNSQILNRRLVYADEIQITNPIEEDRIKLVVNEFIEIEGKGKDAREFRNYANFYISSNNLNSIKLSGDDRRFSIVNLTDTKLIEIFSKKEIENLTNPETIKQFSEYLYHRQVDPEEMLKVFKSERTEQVRASTLKDWEEWILDEFYYDNLGKSIPIRELRDIVEEEFGSRVRPGRQAFSLLSSRFPDKLEIRCLNVDKKRVWSVYFINKGLL